MKDLEDKLEQCSRTRPSSRLDRRMDLLFNEAVARRPPIWARPMAAWQGAVACLVFAAFGFLLHAALPEEETEEPAPTKIYVVEMDQETARRVFVSSPKQEGFLEGPVETRVEIAPLPTREDGSKGDVT